VPSVAPYLDRAAVYGNALGHGAGTSLKLLEAFASGLAVISTEVGARGFPARAGDHFVSAESDQEFAARIVECLADRAARDEGARHARALAEGYDWQELGPRFAAVVEGAVSARRRA
jgi:glycosyltransferase involved in cell wall biosynthesis